MENSSAFQQLPTPDVTVFHDKLKGDAHDVFQRWRKQNPGGFFLNQTTESKFRFHLSKCYHLDPSFEEFDGVVSVTSKPKICSADKQALKEWASKREAEVVDCDCCQKEQ